MCFCCEQIVEKVFVTLSFSPLYAIGTFADHVFILTISTIEYTRRTNHMCRHKQRTDKKITIIRNSWGNTFVTLCIFYHLEYLFICFCASIFLLFYVPYSSYECAISALNNVHYFYQFRWRLYKKASQVFYLHFALKRREFLEEFHEKQEQVSFSGNWFPDLLFSLSPYHFQWTPC